MMKIIYRGLVLALTVIMLLSVICPVAALAEMGVSDNSDTTETTESLETAVETKPIVEKPSTGREKIIQEENPSGAGLEEIIEVDNNLEPVPEAKAEESVEQEIIKTELPAGSTGPASNSTDNSNTQQKQEKTEAGIQAAGGTAEKAAAPSISTGNLSAADGSNKSTRTKTNAELFIDAKGSDETGNGSFEAPFATLEAALNAAKGMGVDAELCLLSNLSVTSAVQILGMNVYLTSNEGACTITRDDAFDLGEGGINTAMFAIGSPAEDSPGGQLILEHVVLNEKGMKTEPVQDGMISVYSGGKLILGEEAALLNYGGESAVYACAGSEVSVSATGWILNDMPFEEDGTVAIREEEGSTVIREAGCIVLSHGEVWEAKLNEEDEQSGVVEGAKERDSTENNSNDLTVESNKMLSRDDDELKKENSINQEEKPQTEQLESKGDGDLSAEETLKPGIIQKKSLAVNRSAVQAASPLGFKLDAPPTIANDDNHANSILSTPGNVEGYLVPYTISFNAGSLLDGISAITTEAIEKVTINLSFTFDNRLYPEMKVVGTDKVISFETNFSAKKSRSTYDESIHTIEIEIDIDDMDSLNQILSLKLNTVLPTASFPASITTENNKLNSNAEVKSIIFAYQGGSSPSSISGVKASAETELLDNYATLTYVPNGGEGGPGTRKLAPQEKYVLDMINVPTHKSSFINGQEIKVVFCGWKTSPDSKIYSMGDKEKLQGRKDVVDLTAGEETKVYAVYSYDENNDGEPDVDQKFLILDFDANGGTGVPAQMIKVAVAEIAASFDIPEKEPTRKYYTFLGWSEDVDATEAEYKYDAPKKADRDITITKDTVLYAVWEENPVYTLYFNGNGGTNVPAAQSARSDNGVAEMTITRQIPTRSGRTFVGWSVQRYGTAAFDPGEDVRLTGGDVTLFAVWERNGSSSGRAPKTGDESNVPLYVVLAVGSAVAAYGIIHVLKKRRK